MALFLFWVTTNSRIDFTQSSQRSKDASFLPQIIFNTSFGGYVLPRIHEFIFFGCLAFGVSLTDMLIFQSESPLSYSLLLLSYYLFLFATKMRRHKVLRSCFITSSIQYPESSVHAHFHLIY
jgi:hypothetical protein